MIRAVLISVFFALLASALSAASSETYSSERLSARLITAQEDIAPGTKTLSAALEVTLEGNWHAYWRSPGEVGLPPEIDWSGPSEGWVLLGQTYMRLGLYTDAAVAFQTSVARGGETSGAYSQLAEALIAAEDGAVSAEAQAAIGRSLQLDPLNPAATYYQAISLQQQGNTGGARDLLIARLERESRAAQWMPSFVNLINRMGDEIGVEPVSLDAFVEPPRGPSAADVEAAQAMSPEEQVAFIESMVDGLAARLEEDPTDLNGWIQLGRSYMVLEREDDARDAFARAAPLITDLPANDPRRAIVERMLSE
ncbi:MAG: c-type cytochrome biogenesis protein CcmI [Pseudomonadota bacterium]